MESESSETHRQSSWFPTVFPSCAQPLFAPLLHLRVHLENTPQLGHLPLLIEQTGGAGRKCSGGRGASGNMPSLQAAKFLRANSDSRYAKKGSYKCECSPDTDNIPLTSVHTLSFSFTVFLILLFILFYYFKSFTFLFLFLPLHNVTYIHLFIL
jgi:hypothetical protein